MKKILILEDSNSLALLIKKIIKARLMLESDIASTIEEGVNLIKKNREEYFLSVLDLNLPDGGIDDVLEKMLSDDIPAILYTTEFDPGLRKRIQNKPVLDYIIKKDKQTIDDLIDIIRRTLNNSEIKILIVDDSVMLRQHFKSLLDVQQFQVRVCGSGKQALQILDNEDDISLMLIDYNMPEMDGYELTRTIREKIPMEKLAIIGISSNTSPLVTVKFLKSGANDFVTKPVIPEELNLRIKLHLDIIKTLAALKSASITDYLTGLYNRRYFFDVAGRIYMRSVRKKTNIAVAMIDIDYFKKINDTYGHAAGDEVLKGISKTLQENLRDSDIIARFGGEEFCIFLSDTDRNSAFFIFERIRKSIESKDFRAESQTIPVTVSTGLACESLPGLEDMISEADRLLYEAKNEGRNRVKISEC